MHAALLRRSLHVHQRQQHVFASLLCFLALLLCLISLAMGYGVSEFELLISVV
jgi:ABC-type transport system involved in cytochrome c biogenesis permease component